MSRPWMATKLVAIATLVSVLAAGPVFRQCQGPWGTERGNFRRRLRRPGRK
jgi:hypothetical protein